MEAKKSTLFIYHCPKCQGTKFKRFALPSLWLVHWVLNPGSALIELVFWQRLPRLTLFCQSCELPLYEREYIPWPNCRTLHDKYVWRSERKGHWLGLVCPTCKARIPSLWNLFSLAILGLTSPIWYLPYRFYFRDRQMAVPTPWIGQRTCPEKISWWKGALQFGAGMWVVMTLLPTIYEYFKTGYLARGRLMDEGIIWLVAGGVWGACMFVFMSRKPGK